MFFSLSEGLVTEDKAEEDEQVNTFVARHKLVNLARIFRIRKIVKITDLKK